MAVSTFTETTKLYDPHYRPDVVGFHAGTRNRRWYDDFSVSEHLHILKPQSVSLTSTSVQDSLRNRPRNSAVVNRSETLPKANQGSPSQDARLCEYAPAGETAEEAQTKSETREDH